MNYYDFMNNLPERSTPVHILYKHNGRPLPAYRSTLIGRAVVEVMMECSDRSTQGLHPSLNTVHGVAALPSQTAHPGLSVPGEGRGRAASR